jgi:hypothetical protein
MVALKAVKSFGLELEGAQFAHSVDKIDGNTAYMNTESKFQGVTRHERVVLKKSGDTWLVADKQ